MKATGLNISTQRPGQWQDSTEFRPAALVAWLVCERSRLTLQVEALRIENERLRSERWKRLQTTFADCA
jgi:hypothetical protein